MNRAENGLATRAAALVDQHPPSEQVDLLIDACHVRLHSNSSGLIEALGSDYRRYTVDTLERVDIQITLLERAVWMPDLPLKTHPPGPGKKVIKEAYHDLADGRLLRKRLTGMVFMFGAGANLAVGPCLENRNQVINFINNRFIQWNLEHGYLLCHAAGVVRGERGLVLAGTSGAGKSTLALDLIARGCDYVSNDRLLLRPLDTGVRMLGVPKLPRINPGTILHNPALLPLISDHERQEFERLPPDELWRLEQKYDADIDRCFGPGRVRLAAPFTATVMLDWKRDAGPLRVSPIDFGQRRDLLRKLIKPLGVHYRVPRNYPADQFGEPAYIELLRGHPALVMEGGVDFAQAADACLELLSRPKS